MWLCCSWATLLALFLASPTGGNDRHYPASVAWESWWCAWPHGGHYMQPWNISLPCHPLCSHPSQPFPFSDPRGWESPGACASWAAFLGPPGRAWASQSWELSKALHQAMSMVTQNVCDQTPTGAVMMKNVGLSSTVTWKPFRPSVVGCLSSPGSIRGWQHLLFIQMSLSRVRSIFPWLPSGPLALPSLWASPLWLGDFPSEALSHGKKKASQINPPSTGICATVVSFSELLWPLFFSLSQ